MTAVHRRYHALHEVSNVLNSQRKMDSFWQACTECIKEVVPWERAGVLLYASEEDGFRFHALETNMPKRVLQRGTIIPRTGSAVGWVYDHREVHVRPDLQQQQVFAERLDDCVRRRVSPTGRLASEESTGCAQRLSVEFVARYKPARDASRTTLHGFQE